MVFVVVAFWAPDINIAVAYRSVLYTVGKGTPIYRLALAVVTAYVACNCSVSLTTYNPYVQGVLSLPIFKHIYKDTSYAKSLLIVVNLI
jgi:hypothetical protein